MSAGNTLGNDACRRCGLPIEPQRLKKTMGAVVKLILHIGMPKSGSTSLQKGLARLRAQLREHGYLYPVGHINKYNHTCLVTGAETPRRFPSNFRAYYRISGGDPEQDFRRWIDNVRATIKAEQPGTLILSGEPLFKLEKPAQFIKLASALRELANRIEIVAYLRKPSDFYISSAQQGLKVSHNIKRFGPISYKAPLEGFASVADAMHVFKYERSELPGGDVLRHFIETLCEGILSSDALPMLVSNASHSAEGLSLLADYRRAYHSDKAGRTTQDIKRLRKAIVAADAAIKDNNRPRLHRELSERINHGSPDLLWLRDSYGIVFDGIDYTRIAPMSDVPQFDRLEQICAIDANQKSKTMLHVVHVLADRSGKKKPTANPGA
jgi:hypothetical protein